MAVAETWEVAKRAIEAYTGLSPATFFTVLAVAAAFYYVVSGFLAPPPPPPLRTREAEPLQPPVQLGEVTEEELRVYDGSDPKKPLLMAIKGQIYDVTQSRMFYGPGGSYALFAGKDASRALAKMSFEPADLTGDISGLGPFELEALQDWEYKFMSKYVKVGTIKKTVPVTEGSDANASEITEKSSQIDANASEITEKSSQIADETGDHPAETTTSSKAEHSAGSKEGGTSGGDDEEQEEAGRVKEKAEGEADAGEESKEVKESVKE